MASMVKRIGSSAHPREQADEALVGGLVDGLAAGEPGGHVVAAQRVGQFTGLDGGEIGAGEGVVRMGHRRRVALARQGRKL